MHLWYLEKWKKYIDITVKGHKTGLYLRCDKNVDNRVKVFCKDFAKWLRKEYFFLLKSQFM